MTPGNSEPPKKHVAEVKNAARKLLPVCIRLLEKSGATTDSISKFSELRTNREIR
jgi:hypothetical protein